MSEFKNTTLRNKINIKHGFSFKGEFFTHEGDFILLTPGNFHEVGGFKFDENKAKFYKGEFPNDYICEKGDLIVAMTEQAEGLLGSSAIVPVANRFLHNQRIGLVKVNDNEIDKMFLYHLMNTKGVREQIRLSSSGSKVKHTSPDRIYDVIVNLPSLPTQQKIASVLSALDTKIELNNRINSELEAMAKTLYDYWFVQFDFPDANGKPYKTSGGDMVWNEELKREIPEGWEAYKIGDVLKTALGGTPSTTDKTFWENGTIDWLSSGEMNNFPIIESNAKITQKAIENSATKLMPKGTVAISITRYIRPTILEIDACANQSVVGICESDTFQNSYLYPYFKNEVSRYMIVRTGANQPHINKETIDESLIVEPESKILTQYYKLAKPLYKQIANNAFENQHLSSLRDWLLPMLMNGQVTVSSVDQLEEQDLDVQKKEALFVADNKKPFAKQVLGGKIVSLFQKDPHFTNIKFQKIQYLAEHVAEVDLNWNYYYQAAGPYDNIYMHTISDKFKTSNWFAKEEHKFTPLEKQGQIDGYYQSFFQPVVNRLDNLFSLLADVTDIEAEIIATLYAVWNNRIILNQPVAEELLIEDFYNWSDRKLLYTPEQLQKGLQWLHTNNIVPNGFGKEMKKAKSKK